MQHHRCLHQHSRHPFLAHLHQEFICITAKRAQLLVGFCMQYSISVNGRVVCSLCQALRAQFSQLQPLGYTNYEDQESKQPLRSVVWKVKLDELLNVARKCLVRLIRCRLAALIFVHIVNDGDTILFRKLRSSIADFSCAWNNNGNSRGPTTNLMNAMKWFVSLTTEWNVPCTVMWSEFHASAEAY